MLTDVNEENQEEVGKITAFADKYRYDELTLADIKNLSFNLSIGSLRCLS